MSNEQHTSEIYMSKQIVRWVMTGLGSVSTACILWIGVSVSHIPAIESELKTVNVRLTNNNARISSLEKRIFGYKKYDLDSNDNGS